MAHTAQYFSSINDISYVISPEETPDAQLPQFQFEHYFVEHPERFPLHFLLDGCRKDEEIIDLLKTDLSGMSLEEKRNLKEYYVCAKKDEYCSDEIRAQYFELFGKGFSFK